MNYSHAFHAGNFADLVKHAALLALIGRLQAAGGDLSVIDTHAGSGLYDLSDPRQLRSREAEEGVARLVGKDLPPVMAALAEAVSGFNPDGSLAVYPGSPVLAASAVAAAGRYLGYELVPPVRAELARALKPYGPRAAAVEGDGFLLAAEALRQVKGQALVLIDPPFEHADDYQRTADLVAEASRRPRTACLVWAPLKDLETLDAFVRRLEFAGVPGLVGECRIRPLAAPMRMNGCALIATEVPPAFEDDLAQACGFVATALGEGGGSRIWRF